jgi:hydrogenase maturation factor
MCLGAITELLEVWEEGGSRLGRLADGSVVTLGFVPDARAGSHVLVHLGVPVEVLALRDSAPDSEQGGSP